MTREEILNDLTENVGKKLAQRADPSYYSCEDRHWAAGYVNSLEETRKAFKAIRAGASPLPILRALKSKVRGTESNAINLLILKIEKA